MSCICLSIISSLLSKYSSPDMDWLPFCIISYNSSCSFYFLSLARSLLNRLASAALSSFSWRIEVRSALMKSPVCILAAGEIVGVISTYPVSSLYSATFLYRDLGP